MKTFVSRENRNTPYCKNNRGKLYIYNFAYIFAHNIIHNTIALWNDSFISARSPSLICIL